MTGDEIDLLTDAIEEICVEAASHPVTAAPSSAVSEAFDDSLWKVLERLGYTLVPVPEEAGGGGGTLAQAAAVIRGAARKGAAVPLAETMWLAGWLLASAELHVPSGPLTAAVGQPPDVELARTADGWRLDGVLRRVPWADSAELLVGLVPARPGAVVVRLDPRAGELVPGQNVAGEPRPDVVFRGVRLADDDVRPAAPGVTVETFASRAALARVVALSGACEEVLRITLAYAREREQFGRPLARFQAVQQLLAQLAAETAAVVVSAQAAVLALDHGPAEHAAFAISAAKASASESAGSVAAWSHQVLGALGTTIEHPLHRLTRRLWAWRDEYGNERHHALGVGRRALSADVWDLVIGTAP